LSKLLFALDRTLVLFVGIAVGAVVGISFFTGGGQPATEAQATPVLPPDQARAAAAARAPAIDGLAPRLASAVAENRKIHIGVFGDSFGDGVWAGLYNILRSDAGFEVHQFSERSTGFTRYRSLNLLDDIRAKLDRQPLEIAIVSFGANDTQGIFLDGHGNTFMSEGWQRIVTERVTAVVGLLRQRGVQVYWVGMPRMREAAFDADISRMNAFYASRMQALNVPYFETATLSADAGGRYAPYLVDPRTRNRVNARTNDGIHMTIPGYIIVMRPLTERIRRSIGQARAQAGQNPAGRTPASRSAGGRSGERRREGGSRG
jgi:hypothetical protein